MLHHIFIDSTKNPMQHVAFDRVKKEHDQNRNEAIQQNQLHSRFLCRPRILAAQVLPCNHGSTGRKRGENIDHKHHDEIHQGNARYRGLTHRRNHDGRN